DLNLQHALVVAVISVRAHFDFVTPDHLAFLPGFLSLATSFLMASLALFDSAMLRAPLTSMVITHFSSDAIRPLPGMNTPPFVSYCVFITSTARLCALSSSSSLRARPSESGFIRRFGIWTWGRER